MLPFTDVFLIEDNAGDTVLIRQILAEGADPVKLHIARDGEQAISMLSDGYFHPTLIIVDLNIPKIDGFALLERWRDGDIPMVVFSSTLEPTERERALALGACEFVAKPSKLEEYIRAVRGILERWTV
jgi:CheY-like chemotaxis protein